MSVAFRREGDDEHLEPAFELPIPPGPNRVTAAGLAAIHAKVTELEGRLATSSDEAAIKALRRDLRYWHTRLSTAEQMPLPGGDKVEFGCTVHFCLNGAERSITIVGDDEADPKVGKLSFSAPLARAMMEACTGDSVDFAGRTDAIRIVSISVADPAKAD
ncbi:nucleoside-diphosphate kinase [Sphingomonas lacunae]|uniref:Nucleoside-diphosphate kinase n=1 Tax=Sphingomonas lacunae TaxID=2698828 RepID=A0A6M4AT95_9SPHN|nr:GreA/GreB family elongation factor [Sphingomonas lacunae]QJQ31299.1 nucleoside-diphosphate kinase [Sphingomonas lacunae]